MNRRLVRFVLGLLVGMALLFAVARFINLATALEKFEDYPWPQLGVVLALSLVYYLLKALRWHYFLSVVDIRLPLRRSLLIYIAGQWFAITPAGEFVRAYLLKMDGFSFSRGSAVVTAQVLFDFLSLAIVGSVSVFWYHEMAVVILPFTVALAVGILAFAYGPTLGEGRWLPFVGGRKRFLGKSWEDFYLHSRHLLGWTPLAIGLAYALPTVLAGAAVLFWVSQGYQIDLSFGQSAYIYSVSQLVGALSMLPHGLGAIEGSSVALFTYVGADAAYAASAVALFRLCTLGWGLVLGGVSLLVLRTPLAGVSSARVD
ncbi:MAG: flippase-like domain-containing protein [Chloroflexi bacterium]|nr:flippase-like domain-containing protein [Chloroflexota bacterium]